MLVELKLVAAWPSMRRAQVGRIADKRSVSNLLGLGLLLLLVAAADRSEPAPLSTGARACEKILALQHGGVERKVIVHAPQFVCDKAATNLSSTPVPVIFAM